MSTRVADAMSFEYDVQTDRWSLSPELCHLHGLGPRQAPTTELLLTRVVDHDRERVRQTIAECLQEPGCYSFAYELRDAQEVVRHVRYVAQSEAGGDEVKRLHGFIVDITTTLHDHADHAVAAAVEHRAVIDQAKGALMVCFGVDDEGAFQLLRGYSTRTNTKLAVVAEHIAKGVSDDRFSRQEPVVGLLDILLALEAGDLH